MREVSPEKRTLGGSDKGNLQAPTLRVLSGLTGFTPDQPEELRT